MNRSKSVGHEIKKILRVRNCTVDSVLDNSVPDGVLDNITSGDNACTVLLKPNISTELNGLNISGGHLDITEKAYRTFNVNNIHRFLNKYGPYTLDERVYSYGSVIQLHTKSLTHRINKYNNEKTVNCSIAHCICDHVKWKYPGKSTMYNKLDLYDIGYDNFCITNSTSSVLYEKFMTLKTLDGEEGEKLIINLDDNIYFPLSAYTHHKYLDHNIKGIKHKAPTLQHWFSALLVKDKDVDTETKRNDLIKHISKYFLAGSANKAVGDVLISEVDNKGNFMVAEIQDAKNLFCRMYERIYLEQGTIMANMISYLSVLCRNRKNMELPILIIDKGYKKISNSNHSPDIDTVYFADSVNSFCSGLCLIEILVKYGDKNKFVWNM